MHEAWITFGFTFVFVGAAYGADRYKATQDAKKEDEEGSQAQMLQNADWTAIEMYRDLVKEKQGEKAGSKEE